ncbi:MAG: T9SS type A sorting domain-containing protein [Lewinellaceae bacterium]|nr:T9SS type A sorting domain-containing protein [Lewinellaceae bacterium]
MKILFSSLLFSILFCLQILGQERLTKFNLDYTAISSSLQQIDDKVYAVGDTIYQLLNDSLITVDLDYAVWNGAVYFEAKDEEFMIRVFSDYIAVVNLKDETLHTLPKDETYYTKYLNKFFSFTNEYGDTKYHFLDLDNYSLDKYPSQIWSRSLSNLVGTYGAYIENKAINYTFSPNSSFSALSFCKATNSVIYRDSNMDVYAFDYDNFSNTLLFNSDSALYFKDDKVYYKGDNTHINAFNLTDFSTSQIDITETTKSVKVLYVYEDLIVYSDGSNLILKKGVFARLLTNYNSFYTSKDAAVVVKSIDGQDKYFLVNYEDFKVSPLNTMFYIYGSIYLDSSSSLYAILFNENTNLFWGSISHDVNTATKTLDTRINTLVNKEYFDYYFIENDTFISLSSYPRGIYKLKNDILIPQVEQDSLIRIVHHSDGYLYLWVKHNIDSSNFYSSIDKYDPVTDQTVFSWTVSSDSTLLNIKNEVILDNYYLYEDEASNQLNIIDFATLDRNTIDLSAGSCYTLGTYNKQVYYRCQNDIWRIDPSTLSKEFLFSVDDNSGIELKDNLLVYYNYGYPPYPYAYFIDTKAVVSINSDIIMYGGLKRNLSIGNAFVYQAGQDIYITDETDEYKITSIPQEHLVTNIYQLGNKVLFKILNDPASIYYVILYNPETREIEKYLNSDFNLLATYNGKFLITENDGKTLKIVDESLNEIKLFDKQNYSPKYFNLQFQDNQLVVFTEESSIKGQEMAIVNMDKEIIQHFDIYPGYKNSNPRNFSVINNELYFTAYSKNLGYQLWKLGIDEILSTENPKAEVVKNTLHFYPNPALDRIQFDDEIDIKVYDLNGRMVLNHNACESLDVSTLPAGMYILISSNGIGKLLKE